MSGAYLNQLTISLLLNLCEEILGFRLKQFLSLLLSRILSGIGHIHERLREMLTTEANCMKKEEKNYKHL